MHHKGTEGTEVHGDNITFVFSVFSVPSVPPW